MRSSESDPHLRALGGRAVAGTVIPSKYSAMKGRGITHFVHHGVPEPLTPMAGPPEKEYQQVCIRPTHTSAQHRGAARVRFVWSSAVCTEAVRIIWTILLFYLSDFVRMRRYRQEHNWLA